jgi:transcriptional regulator with GAF, ATPase, and Fis domain
MRGPRDTVFSISELSGLAKTVAEAKNFDAVFSAVADAASTWIGHRLFTVMAFDAESMEVERLYSSNPEAYPPGGRKLKRDTAWGRRVLEEGCPFIGRNADDIRSNFSDHKLILGLGLESVINVPVRILGRTIGTMNLLHDADYYDMADLECGYFLAGQLVGPLCMVKSASSCTR